MKFTLYRTRTRQLTTDGVLRDEYGARICDTAEYTPKMLAAGTYKVVLRKHPKLKHRAPYIRQKQHTDVSRLSPFGGVEGAKGWAIHGNGVFAKGFGSSIIVGDHLVPGVVIRSAPYFDRLIKRMEKVFKRGHEVELLIK